MGNILKANIIRPDRHCVPLAVYLLLERKVFPISELFSAVIGNQYRNLTCPNVLDGRGHPLCVLCAQLIRIKRGQAMAQATFTIQIWVAFSPLPEELPHTRMNWPDARSAAVASDISDLAPPS